MVILQQTKLSDTKHRRYTQVIPNPNKSLRPDCAAIVCSIINLGQNLNMTTVAEGVETEVQLDMLRLAGCPEAQGYLFSRPRPANELHFGHALELAS